MAVGAQSAVSLGCVRVARLIGFLVLLLRDGGGAVAALAFEMVAAMELWRAPTKAKDLARRRAEGLSPRQADRF